MKKYCLRIIVLVLTTVLVVSTFPTPSRAFAVQTEKMYVNQVDQSNKESQVLSENLKPFSGTDNLIASMKAELSQSGLYKINEKDEKLLQVLSDTVMKKCGYTLAEVRSLLTISIFQERDKDKIDVSKYNLSTDEITTIIDLVLKDYCVTDIIDVSVNADANGIAHSISINMSKGFEAGLDALDKMNGVGIMYPAVQNIENKGTSTASPKARSIQSAPSDASLDETETPPITHEENEPHIYDEPTFTWSAINIDQVAQSGQEAPPPYTCTATFICSGCGEETTVDCTVTRDKEQENAIIYKATCEFEGKNYSDDKDATTDQLYAHWGKLCTFYNESDEYFGISTEYWTSKTTKNNPFGALKVLAGFELDTPVPAPNMDELIDGITQAFSAYVYYYGDALLQVREGALQCLDDNMTDLQKCLVLHDYLSMHAVFDMSSLINYQNNQGQTDPISMTPFGALLYGKVPGIGGSVCLGYATTYTYLIQSAFPKIYRDDNGEFKNYEDVIESGQDMVDFVMIKYDCDVAAVGITGGEGGFEGRFTEPHYWNAVKLDGQWYNVDVCYDDIKTETLTQYRVETDGNLSHMYFLVSDQTIRDWYEGYFEYIDTLHAPDSEEPCDNQQYEDAWFTNIDHPLFYDDEYWYFVEAQFSDRDMIDMFQDEDGEDGNSSGGFLSDMDEDQILEMMRDNGDQMKARPRSADDLSETGTVIFDYGTGTVTNLKTNETTAGVLEEDCNDDMQINIIYPDLVHALSLYDNTLYFNLDNKIYMYSLGNGAVTQLKEYNKVYAKSDGSPFTGSSYYITNANDENLSFVINNHPLAALCIKDDGIMYVSVATNYSNSECSNYEVESVNFNLMHNRYAKDKPEDENDNSEFMWCANVKDNINMSDVMNYLSGGAESEKVVIDSWCDKQGYEEYRDIAHGFSAGVEKNNHTNPKGHHYIFIDGEGCYICSRCHKALSTEKAEEQGVEVKHIYGEPVFSWIELEDGGYECTATFTCEFGDGVQSIEATVTSNEENSVYTATCEFEGKTYTNNMNVGATLTGIIIKHGPTKTKYIEGEVFDASGMIVEATYSDESKKEITGYTVAPTGALTEADTTITVSYEEFTATVNITVEKAIVDPTVTGIKVVTNPAKIAYTEGETFDPTGMVVEKTKSDGTSEAITNYTCSPAGALTEADTTITVSYEEFTATVTITVEKVIVDPTVTGIKVVTNPVKTIYTEGETFDPTGMVVEKTNSDGKSDIITDYTWSPTGALTEADTTITVSYEEYTATVTITVEKASVEPTITGIKVVTNPAKTVYTEGEAFSATGMVVAKTKSDGTSERITNYNYSPKGALTISNTTITVSYETFTTTLNITVNRSNSNPGNNNPNPGVPSGPIFIPSAVEKLEPEVEGNSSVVGWDKIIAHMQQLLSEASSNEAKTSQISIAIDMNDTTMVPKNVFEVMQGHKIEVVFKLDNGSAWIVNGENITESMLTGTDFAINYSNQIVPKEQMEALLGAEAASKVSASQFSIKYNETIGYDAILSLDLNRQISTLKENKDLQELAQTDKDKMIANLFYYNLSTGKLNLLSVDRVSVDGKADFSLASNSDYVVILSNQVIFDADTLAKVNVNGIVTGQSFNKTLYIGGTEGQTEILTANIPKVIQEAINEHLVTGGTYYYSSNSSIAKVNSSGKVTANKEGKASITVNLVLGENKYEYTMQAIVKKAYIQFKESTPALGIGKKARFTVSVGGYDITKLEWKTSKKDIAVVKLNVGEMSAYVTGLTKGTDYIYVRIPLKNGKYVTKKVKIKIEAS